MRVAQLSRLGLGRGAVARLATIDRILEKTYGTPEKILGNQDDPLDEAIYIILSFQTDLARCGLTWSKLRETYPSWESAAQAPTGELSTAIRQGGLQWQKALAIKRLLAEVRRIAGGLSLGMLSRMSDPDAERLLTRLPGLSRKGARCVLLYSLRRDVFPVDVNTFRILRRAGVLSRSAVYRRRSLHDTIQATVSAPRRRILHVNLVVHGQRVCLPRAPQCPRCAIVSTCRRTGVGIKAMDLSQALHSMAGNVLADVPCGKV